MHSHCFIVSTKWRYIVIVPCTAKLQLELELLHMGAPRLK